MPRVAGADATNAPWNGVRLDWVASGAGDDGERCRVASGATGATGAPRCITLNVGAIIGGLGVVCEEAVGAIDLLGQLHKAFGDGGVDAAMQKQEERDAVLLRRVAGCTKSSQVRQVESGAPRCDRSSQVRQGATVSKHTRILMSRSMRWILQRLATCALYIRCARPSGRGDST
jgi:hypothetical protein